MQYGQRISRLLASRSIFRGHPDPAQHRAGKFRYRHVLVSTSLNSDDRAALLLGFELAAVHQATLTLLQVLPRDQQDRAAHGLDAIGLLHTAAEELWKTSAQRKTAERVRQGLGAFVEGIVPQELLNLSLIHI